MSVGIDPKYLQATIYLYPSASSAREGVSVGGSGFILGVMSPDNSLICRYAVTNKHVIDGGCRVIRTNTPNGSLRIVETPPEAWTCALDDDLAVAELDGPAGTAGELRTRHCTTERIRIRSADARAGLYGRARIASETRNIESDHGEVAGCVRASAICHNIKRTYGANVG